MSLRDALDDHSIEWYLDLRSGDLIPVLDDPGLNEDIDTDEIEAARALIARMLTRAQEV